MHASDINPYAELVTSDGGLGRIRIENLVSVDGTDRMVLARDADPEAVSLELQYHQVLALYYRLAHALGMNT